MFSSAEAAENWKFIADSVRNGDLSRLGQDLTPLTPSDSIDFEVIDFDKPPQPPPPKPSHSLGSVAKRGFREFTQALRKVGDSAVRHVGKAVDGVRDFARKTISDLHEGSKTSGSMRSLAAALARLIAPTRKKEPGDDFVLVEAPSQDSPQDEESVDGFVVIDQDDAPVDVSGSKWKSRHWPEVDARWDAPARVVSKARWRGVYLGQEGQVQERERLREDVFYSGVAPGMRSTVWPFLLGVYDWSSTAAERKAQRIEFGANYELLKSKWTALQGGDAHKMLRHNIFVDVKRTDRGGSFEHVDDEWKRKLEHLLLTYAVACDPSLGYCQGMSDLAACFLYVTESDEAMAFWLFRAFMLRMGANFRKGDDNGIGPQLECVAGVIKTINPRVYAHLEAIDVAPAMFFAFRWILVVFRREFGFDDTMRLWDALLSERLEVEGTVPRMPCGENPFSACVFFAVAIFKRYFQQPLMERKMCQGQLFARAMQIKNAFDVDVVLRSANVVAMDFLDAMLEQSS